MKQAADYSRADLIKLARQFRTKKSLGQNFLVEPSVLQAITDALDATEGDTILEIGPGIGFLTRFLTNTGARVVAVELDTDAVSDLRASTMPNLEVVHADFLAFDPTCLQSKFKVAGNVPYQITTPIVARLFGEIGQPQPWLAQIEKVVLTVQLEVAQRFVATPDTRDYSQITLLTQYFSEPKLLLELGAEEFYPSPNVRSAVVEFTPRKEPPIQCNNYRLLRSLIKSGFSQRRKMLRNNLGFLKLDGGTLVKVFHDLKLDPQVRAERLSLEKYCQMANYLDALPEYQKQKSN
ncbi:MAG TPA: 16S rRNA (adenine(1518)-N(6)/adenine(1519)-N(6))-dimethyltransferase RsmA [Oculatellaceae cyanobacterium]